MMGLSYQRICLVYLYVTVCSMFICINGQCSNNGDCLNGGSCQGQVCTCTPNWTGPTCESSLMGYCANTPCLNGGSCVPVGTDYRCNCRPAHTGMDCGFLANYSSCGQVPCDAGECIDEGDGYIYCECTPFTGGAFCERTPSCSNRNPCIHGGTCVDGVTNDDPSSCACNSGWTGDVCEFPLKCNTNTCRNDGTCEDPVSSGELAICLCADDWEGPTCEDPVPTCNDLGCFNGGTCYSGTCICPLDFSGEFCEDYMCESDVCYNGGTCEFGTTLYCYCPDGFSGDFCEIDLNMCGSDVCYYGATCIESGNTTYCICPVDYTGEFCEIGLNICGSDICYNGGTCVDAGSTFYCACSEDFTGNFCEIVLSPCISEPCQNGGTCVDIFSDSTTIDPGSTPAPVYYVCECPSGYSGQDCEMITPCIPNPCMNNGVCSVQNGVRRCACAAGFQGQYCDDPPPNTGLSQETIGIIAGSAAAAVIVIVIVIAIACCCCRKKRSDDKDQLTGLELGVNQRRRRSHDYIPSPTKTMMPSIPNLRVSKMRDETKMEFPRNRLTFLNKLGSGSFADVYKAEAYGITEKDAKSIVAVKKLKDTATENDKSDLSKEISVFMFLDPHPNIVNILGCCTECDPWYIIMEYLPYGNLQGYLRQIRTGGSVAPEYKNVKKQTDIPPNDLLNFGVQIARGMEYLASRACIHRDLAARNILLGEGWVCKVSDFGLARDLEDGQTYEMKSQGRVPVRWMSPESLLHNTYTSQSDVWSFAILIWEIVTLGSHPYPGMSSKQVVKEISAGYRLPKPEHCSQDIYNLMKECWAYDPEERPTFTQVKLKLENMLADAQGYLVMSDFNDDNYLYLDPDQHTGDTLDEGFSHLE